MDLLDMWDMEGARPVWFNVRQYSPPTTRCRNAADFYYWKRKHWNSSITGRDLDNNVQKHWTCNLVHLTCVLVCPTLLKVPV